MHAISNVTPSLSKGFIKNTNPRDSKRLILLSCTYKLCTYICVYIYYVYGLSNRGVEIYRYLERTSGGHSRSLASLGHGHFVAGPRFPSPIPLLIFCRYRATSSFSSSSSSYPSLLSLPFVLSRSSYSLIRTRTCVRTSTLFLPFAPFLFLRLEPTSSGNTDISRTISDQAPFPPCVPREGTYRSNILYIYIYIHCLFFPTKPILHPRHYVRSCNR